MNLSLVSPFVYLASEKISAENLFEGFNVDLQSTADLIKSLSSYNPTKHPNWKYLANQETDERWWNYQINPMNQRQENHLDGLRIRDLTFESSLK